MAETRVALVTGGNRGIGFELCRQLKNKGLRVIMGARDIDKGRSAAEELGVDWIHLDVTELRHIEHVTGTIGRLDILINNAGISPVGDQSVLNVGVEVMRQVMETNVYGALRLTQSVVPLMRKNGYGRIVNVSSGMGSLKNMTGGHPAYRLSKTSLNAMTRILASELRGTGILVNAVCPGWVKTDMGGPGADRDVVDSVDTILWLATLPADGPSGFFFRDRKMMPW